MNDELLKRVVSTIVIIPIALFFIIKGSIFFNLFIFACFLLTTYEWHKMTWKNYYYYFEIIFLIFSFYSIYCLRNDNPSDYAYLLAVLVIFISSPIPSKQNPNTSKPHETLATLAGQKTFMLFMNLSFSSSNYISKNTCCGYIGSSSCTFYY